MKQPEEKKKHIYGGNIMCNFNFFCADISCVIDILRNCFTGCGR